MGPGDIQFMVLVDILRGEIGFETINIFGVAYLETQIASNANSWEDSLHMDIRHGKRISNIQVSIQDQLYMVIGYTIIGYYHWILRFGNLT